MDKLNDKLREYLRAPRFAVVATINEDGTPQQTVVWYELQEGDRIMMNTRAGRSGALRIMRVRRAPYVLVVTGKSLTYRGRPWPRFQRTTRRAWLQRSVPSAASV